jgi:hypothetical protein
MSGVLQERERSLQGGAEDCQEMLEIARSGCRLAGEAEDCQERHEAARTRSDWRLQERLETARRDWRLPRATGGC